MFNQEECFEMLLFCTKWQSHSKMTGLQTRRKKKVYKYLMQYYPLKLDSIILATCFLSISFLLNNFVLFFKLIDCKLMFDKK